MHVAGQDQPGQSDRLHELVGRAGWSPVHGRRRLGQEVLDDHFLDVAVAPVGGGDGLERADAVGSRLTDADENTGGERNGQAARRLEGRQSTIRSLVGGAIVASQIGVEGFEHHPL